MRTGRRAVAGNAGFTLIEILIAMVIMVLLAGTIYGSLQAANRNIVMAEERTDVMQTARVLLDQLITELEGAYQPSFLEESSLTGTDTSEGTDAMQTDSLQFITLSGGPTDGSGPRSGLRLVNYYIGTGEDGETTGLYMEEDPLPGLRDAETLELEPVLLSKLVIGFDCSYLDRDSGEWVDEWTGMSASPAAVRAEFILLPERSGAVPLRISALANIPLTAVPETPEPTGDTGGTVPAPGGTGGTGGTGQ